MRLGSLSCTPLICFQATDQSLADVCMMVLNKIHLLFTKLDSFLMCVKELIKYPIALLTIHLQHFADGAFLTLQSAHKTL
jgi:site-specific recombinase